MCVYESRTRRFNSVLTFRFLPVSFSISCLAMSDDEATHILLDRGSIYMSRSHSQARLATLAYAPAGVACVTLMLVTTPVLLPANCAHFMLDTAWLAGSLLAKQSRLPTLPDTPMVSMLPFTPVRYAVAEHAESAT